MLQIQLYIEGQEVELYKDESVTLTQSIQDIRDIEKIFTDYTRTFTVPASKNNNKIFKHFYNYFIEGFDARKKKDAQLYLNYKPFKKGKIKLEGVSLQNNEARDYRITFFGSTVVLPDLLGEDRLASLTELSAFDFRYNDTNIQAYMTNGLDNNIGSTQINDAIIFPLITHTNRLIYDSALNQVYNLEATGSDNGVPFGELKPALRIDAIIRAIEMHYDIEFSDDFFNSTNIAYYNLYLWLHTKAGSLFVDQDKAQQFSRLQLTGTKFDELTVRSNNFRINNADIKVEFHYKVTIVPALSSVEYNLVIQRNGQEFKRFDGLKGTTINGLTSYTTEDAIIVDNGEFSFFIETESATSFDMNILLVRVNNRFLGGNKDVTLSATLQTFTDTNIAIVTQLPDMKIIDFLTGLFKMFNLTAYVKDNGTIVIQTLDDFYATSAKTYNITEYVVTDESQVDSPIPYKQVNLGYESTETFLAKNFKRIANKDWGRLEYQSQAKFEGNIYSINLPFEHLLYERLTDVDTGNETNVQWGWYVDDKQEASAEKPLLFYPIKADSGDIAARTIANTKVTITTPYMPSNSESIWTAGGDMSQSINFHSEIDEYVRIPNEKTLFKTYYQDYIKDLFDVRKRITTISAYLPLSITENLSLADNLKIFDKLYRINTITTNFETNKSDLVLTNLIDTIVVAGTTPVVEVAQPANTQCAATEVDISSDNITADTTILSADRGTTTADGFSLPALEEPVPSGIEGNQLPDQCLQPCTVTAATIDSGSHVSYGTVLEFNFDILVSGKICDINNIDEYGFLIASQESYLNASNNIDTLKADSNITTVATVRAEGNPSLTVGVKSTLIKNLTHPAERCVRFYVKTNNSPDYAEANVISNTLCATTDTGDTLQTGLFVLGAGVGTTTGYSTIPTLTDINAKSNVTQGAGKCNTNVLFEKWYHNGNGTLPITGDKLKISTSDDYTGGVNSFPSITGASSGTGKYMAFAMAADTGTQPYYTLVQKYIVVEFDTAEVVAVYNCPVNVCDDTLYAAGGSLSQAINRGYVGTIGVGAVANGLNVIYNNKTTVATFITLVYSDNYDDLNNLPNIHDAVDDYISNGTLPTNVNIEVIESTNKYQDGSYGTWDVNGFLQNGGVGVRKTIAAGTYYARLTIGWCDKSIYATMIITTRSL